MFNFHKYRDERSERQISINFEIKKLAPRVKRGVAKLIEIYCYSHFFYEGQKQRKKNLQRL
ncbi:hypothetical protein A3H09_03605 [Candidatus Falkowbacteria bacterium RIFCSPLOWO2_12_FULL_45_13]|uniref:Uncharacterized protein n=2 Tax=Candidatus Falkowiibacteriota TaxID=1752728 RepID=A0A1F5SBU0_9BACT|nr:MAG: hypothetical protein A3H66_00885 [Candidatus Falkowbacteria bacterium RIFCSPLOWO2_02_FULL_45_21]OGF31979.1 MAG: hypothetical protein A3H09_03605 [Candidatus Falkowbacteria bacterium RIFCSPLOWO2_12_FULL_45_13]